MKLLLFAAIFFAASATALASPAEITRMPDYYKTVKAQLVQACGPARAQAMANLTWDIDIHKAWEEKVQEDPSQQAAMGTSQWHRYWISVYRQTIDLLAQDCTALSQPVSEITQGLN